MMIDVDTLYCVLDLCVDDLGHQYKDELDLFKARLQQLGCANMYPGLLRDCRLFAGWCQRYRDGKRFLAMNEKDIKDYLQFCSENLRLDPVVFSLHRVALSYLYAVFGNMQNSQLLRGDVLFL